MGGACLFDMRADPTEHFNVAMQEPELVKTLKVGDLDSDAAISERTVPFYILVFVATQSSF